MKYNDLYRSNYLGLVNIPFKHDEYSKDFVFMSQHKNNLLI